ncbi:E3 ubiquitin-protein ligase siah-1-like [Cloeon dipterum]|uniref:E3 ubiquitin-protein ligase siah-1-like n=1 Tax=Cloeon dipterum TaxID=197152 RepID=UPI0032203D51
MDSSRKGGAGPSGIYRRIIPPLNDTDSDSSLEYWEERGDNFSSRLKMVNVKREPIDPDEREEEATPCLQRIVYKIKNNTEPERPPRSSAGSSASQVAAAVPTAGSQISASSSSSSASTANNQQAEDVVPRRNEFWNLQKLSLTPQDCHRRDMLRMSAHSAKRSSDLGEHRVPLSEEDVAVQKSVKPVFSCAHKSSVNSQCATPPNSRSGNESPINSTELAPLSSPSSKTQVMDTTASPPPSKRPKITDESAGLNSNILSMIECPVCLEYMGPPINQCRRGHLVCSSCRAQLGNCPTCRSRFTDLRNLVLERIVEMIKYPCKHDNCDEMLLLKNKCVHELNCLHRRYTCMAQGCDWRGIHSELVPHVRSVHSGLIHDGNKICISFPLQMLTNSSRNYVLHAYNEMFRVNFQRGPANSIVHGAVIYLGPIDNAKNFTFEFAMHKEKDRTERALTFKRTVLSDDQKPSSYYSKSEAFCVTTDVLRLLSTSKGKVHVDIHIERKIHKKDPVPSLPVAGSECNDDQEDNGDKIAE